ncbi:LysR family transcriptional regulator [Labrys wisconsinensis]|uniref:DNA-binding transcriptional LysR family regulator n=1 Tax=Labrys wisconsinensis TaxID=425677 RepID=A0ABU0JGV0_9HYPH|nr:LysR family transcriptional regulator [Labrys wisconsinensis]MDQ0472469.1 DNA-binding transcriptional LysR family regulator [Labrys wisconsinensis]
MLDRVLGMQVFARVAALGGFSAAARVLGMSQTMATKHVAALEERLGVKLFHRTTRRVTLTEAGRRYLEFCERILVEMDEAEQAAAADRVEPRGLLRLAVPVSFGVREIAPLLADFTRLHPQVSVELGLNDRVVDLVEEGWDLAVRIGLLRDSSLVARRLAPCRIILCATPAYLRAHGTPRTIADLAGHDCLGYTLPTPATADRWVFGETADIVVPVTTRLRANNGDALLAAALAGQGLIYQPTFILGDDIRAGRLVPLALDHPVRSKLAVHALMPPGRNPPAKVRAFVDFLALRFWPEAPWDRGLGFF